jgi:hypothetical protein
MKIEVYVVTEAEAISLLEDGDIDGFKQLLEDDKTLLFSEPEVFNTEAEALAFCAGIGYGKEGYPVEKYPLRSFEPSDIPFIEAIKAY